MSPLIKTLFLPVFVGCCLQGLGQKNVMPATKSEITGIQLPANTKLDKRTLIRAAAKATMDMEAADSGLTLGDSYEIFQLPVSPNNTITDSIMGGLKSNGWKMKVDEKNKQWSLAEKGGKQVMVYLDAGKKESWLYLASVAGKASTGSKTDSTGTTSKPVMPAQPAIIPADKKPETLATITGKYQFSTTHFDDGWVATEKPGWIEVVKGNMTVLIHFANAAIDMSSGQTPVINANAWNVLIAPRYQDKREYYAFNGNMSYMRSSATSAIMTDKQGVSRYVVLFRRGSGAFMEFIAPDRATFEKEFGMNISEANSENLIWSGDDQWHKMDNMQGRNKFAVGMQDLAGQWTESSGSYAQMYYTNTGNYAGMNAISNSAQFWLNADGSYRSQHKGASGMVGSQTFFQEEYKGKYSMNGNWEISMTNRYNGKTDVYWCQFEIVKDGRILHLTDKTASGVQYHLSREKE